MRYRCRSASGSRYSYLHQALPLSHRHARMSRGTSLPTCRACKAGPAPCVICVRESGTSVSLQALYLQAPSNAKAQTSTVGLARRSPKQATKKTLTATEAALKRRRFKTQSKPQSKRLKLQPRQPRQHSKAQRSQAQSTLHRKRLKPQPRQPRQHSEAERSQPLPGNG